MATTTTDHSSSLLLCEEDSASLDDASYSPPPLLHQMTTCSHTNYVDDDVEYIQHLTTRERTSHVHNLDASSSLNDPNSTEWLHFARSDSVRWIVKERQRFGFSLQTAYLAVAYLDRFLARANIENRQMWAVKLLSFACMTLAAKLEECQAPVFSKFQVEEYHFDGRSIQRMELMVLTALEWKIRLVTPFPYLHYLVTKFQCNLPQPREVLVEAANMILAAIESMNSIDHPPSVLAVAAFFAASGLGLTKEALESDVGVISAHGSLEAEHVISCYNRIQELRRKNRIKVVINDKTSDVLSIRSKRRRLAFNPDDCRCLICNQDGSV